MQYFYNKAIDIFGYMRIMKAYIAKHKQTKHILGGTKNVKIQLSGSSYQRRKTGNFGKSKRLELYKPRRTGRNCQ